MLKMINFECFLLTGVVICQNAYHLLEAIWKRDWSLDKRIKASNLKWKTIVISKVWYNLCKKILEKFCIKNIIGFTPEE